MKRHKPDFGQRALGIVRHYFPQVMRVNDADKPVLIEVTQADVNYANDKDHKVCALAVACKRAFKADGVIIGLTRSYVINGTVATRYNNADTVSREITSFDRKAGFDVGFYHLTPPYPSMRFGVPRSSGPRGKSGRPGIKTYRHFTGGVRTVLGGRK